MAHGELKAINRPALELLLRYPANALNDWLFLNVPQVAVMSQLLTARPKMNRG